MAFIRDVFAQSNGVQRRKLNSTPAYAGGIFPVKPGSSGAFTVGASSLSYVGNFFKAYASIKGKDEGGLANAALGALKDAARIGVQVNELGRDSVVAMPIFFQYFPASISESRSSGVETLPTPGLSLPIPTFSGPSPRNISMRVSFSRERWTPGAGLPVESWDKYNVDVAVAVQSLRALSYPIGTGDIASVGVTPQPFKLVLPGVGLGVSSLSDTIYCFLDSYQVEYAAFFPDGQPRLAHVDLSMQEMLIDLSLNETGRSFRQAIAAYSRGAANIFTTDQNQEVRGKTKRMDVSTNKLS